MKKMASYQGYLLLANLLLLTTVLSCLAAPKWIEIEENERMVHGSNRGFADVQMAKNKLKDGLTFTVDDAGKASNRQRLVCPPNCYPGMKGCQKCNAG